MAFQQWMQTQAAALDGRGDDLSTAIGSLEPFASQATDALRILDSDEQAVSGLISNGGEVFDALSERQGQLSGLIRASNTVFQTTANRNAELEEIFRIFPTFLRESRATLARLEEFAIDTDPLVTQLRPAARELSPTLTALGDLAPDLEAFLRGFDDTITASRDGLPATSGPPGRGPPAAARPDRPVLRRGQFVPRDDRALQARVGRAAGERRGGHRTAHHRSPAAGTRTTSRTSAVFGPQSLAAYDNRLRVDRSNPYLKPLGYLDLPGGLESFETRHCDGGAADPNGDQALLDDGDAAILPRRPLRPPQAVRVRRRERLGQHPRASVHPAGAVRLDRGGPAGADPVPSCAGEGVGIQSMQGRTEKTFPEEPSKLSRVLGVKTDVGREFLF